MTESPTVFDHVEQVDRGKRRRNAWNIVLITLLLLVLAAITGNAIRAEQRAQDSKLAALSLAEQVQAACLDSEVIIDDQDICNRATEVADNPVSGAPPTSVPGRDGKDGLDGKDGRDGIDGVNGIDGVSPPSLPGRDGTNGLPGLSGMQGEPGPTGPAGEPGATGPTGPAGEPGPAGPVGPAGPTGPAGEPGVPGSFICPDGMSEQTLVIDEITFYACATDR